MTPHDTPTQPPPATAEIPDAAAARRGGHDLRALGRGAPGRDPAARRRRRAPRHAALRADPRQPAARARAGPARGLRAGDRPPLHPALAAQPRPRHRPLSARLVHDEAQPAPEREGRGAARARAAASRPGPEARPGRARADVEPGARAVGDLRAAARLAATVGRLARRARRAPAHPRLPRRPRGAADQGAHRRHGPRHQPGDRDHGRLRGGQGGDRRARRSRRRRPARQGLGRGRLPDADQPEHARPLRRADRRDRRGRPRGRRHPLLRRRQPERDHGLHPAGRHGLRHRPPEPAQVVQPAARGRGARVGADRRLRPDRALPAGAADRLPPRRLGQRRRAELRPRPLPARSRSAGCAASRATSASSSAPTPTSPASAATASTRPRRPPSSTPITCSRSCAPGGLASTCRRPSIARRCTSSCSRGRRPSASST